MSFALARKIGFDTETTAPDPNEARIVTAAIVVRGGGKPDQTFNYLINPQVPIPPETTAIHGIDDAKAQAEGQDPKVALEDIAAKLAAALRYGMPVIAFNLSYDWTVLTRDLARHGLPSMDDRLEGIGAPALLDPHVIDKAVDRWRKGTGMRKLKPTCGVYGIELEDWHEAAADALAAVLIAEAQFVKYPRLNQYSPGELFVEQQAGLQEWFRTKASAEQGGDPEKVIDGSWPLVPAGVSS